MSKLNTKGGSHVKKAKSYEGNIQFEKTAEVQLYELITMSFFGKDTFYEDTDTKVERIKSLVSDIVDRKKYDFLANIAVHARVVMLMRTMPIIMVVEFAKALSDQNKDIHDKINAIQKDDEGVLLPLEELSSTNANKVRLLKKKIVSYPKMRQLVCDVIQRADEITDMYAYALQRFGTKDAIPVALKRGVGDAMNKFNAYHFKKYHRDGAVTFARVLRMVHPVPKDEKQGKVFDMIMKDALPNINTWETKLSVNGQTEEKREKKEVWEELIDKDDMGYMALLRNLRNFLDNKVSVEHLAKVIKKLSNKEEVAKSKQLPFRFLNALDAVSSFNNNKVNAAISKAMDHSLGNVPKIGEKVWVILDCSLSMTSEIHQEYLNRKTGKKEYRKLSFAPIDIGSLLASACIRSCAESGNFAVTMFSDFAKMIQVNPMDTVSTIATTLKKSCFGGGTDLLSALNMKNKLGFEPDTVILVSDMQVNSLNNVNVDKLFNKKCIKIAINTNAYGSTPASELNGWKQLVGFSDAIFKFIPALRGKNNFVSLFSNPYTGVDGVRSILDIGDVEEDI